MTSRSTPVSIENVYLLVNQKACHGTQIFNQPWDIQGLDIDSATMQSGSNIVYYYTPPPMFLACVRCSDSGARVNNRALEKTSRNWGERRRSPQSSPLYFVLLTSFYSS